MSIDEFDHPDHGFKWQACEVRWIEAKIAEAAAAEREACAKLAEKMDGGCMICNEVLNVADAIRARSNVKFRGGGAQAVEEQAKAAVPPSPGTQG